MRETLQKLFKSPRSKANQKDLKLGHMDEERTLDEGKTNNFNEEQCAEEIEGQGDRMDMGGGGALDKLRTAVTDEIR
jgi:hypothetical protein